ncbi:TonB-dependent receptor [Sphingomonas sp. RB3P16]|uniref:TonB-dependent receptor domain-containing protein n=1 Tax=Parasphingomonas frigoris TaxID=3096163 RepID=UPI002FCA47EA
MKPHRLLITVAPLALVLPAFAYASPVPAAADAPSAAVTPAVEASVDKAPAKEVFSTGVAKARDLLDSAISTSALDQHDILKLSPLSVADLLRDLPGVRSDASQGEGYGNISIRGLPIASTGSKFVQLQEDGLPVLEFGDIAFATADTFLRFDSTVGEVQAIRGGSASTFASNSPGGVINFISKTGVNPGGSIQTTLGLDYRSYRLDFDYGAPLSDTLRVNVGGFYRRGEGPRAIGYDGQDGGQIKINVTKTFAGGGYVRVYGKYLNDRTPAYGYIPMQVTGSDGNPTYSSIPGFDLKRDTLLSRNFTTIVGLDQNNNLAGKSMRDGQHPVVKAAGFEAQFDVAGWSVTDRFRYSGISGSFVNPEFVQFAVAPAVMGRVGGFGGTLTYASGPNAGKTITNPSTLNGNGLLAAATYANNSYNNLDNVTNDIRASRTWNIGSGALTTTGGFYKSRQNIGISYLWSSVLQDVVGGGNASLIDVTSATGTAVTQNGFYGFGAALLGGCCRNTYDMAYDVNAPYGSVNYHIGKLSVGASARYDMGSANGTYSQGGQTSYDINGDGKISDAESRTSLSSLSSPGLIDYSYHTLSYSVSANYRLAQAWSLFGRYSRGGRANSERIVDARYINFSDGSLRRASAAVDHVTQAEGGFKYRTDSTMFNLTAFWAESQDTNLDPRNGAPIDRLFRAKGVEFEGSYTRGIASIAAGATYTSAKIAKDGIDPTYIGKTPHNQAHLIYQVTPQINADRFTVGAVFIGTTGSYATDENLLRLPAYVTTNAFVQLHATKQLLLSVNANNLFDVAAITGVLDATIPAGGIVQGRTLTGRTLSATARLDF